MPKRRKRKPLKAVSNASEFLSTVEELDARPPKDKPVSVLREVGGGPVCAHESYIDNEELEAWGCACKNQGLCIYCAIRARLRASFGIQGVAMITERMRSSSVQSELEQLGAKIKMSIVELAKGGNAKGKTLILSFPGTLTDSQLGSLKGIIEQAQERLISICGFLPSFLLLEEGMVLAELDEDKMEKAGWVRAEPVAQTLETVRRKYRSKEGENVQAVVEGKSRPATGTSVARLLHSSESQETKTQKGKGKDDSQQPESQSC